MVASPASGAVVTGAADVVDVKAIVLVTTAESVSGASATSVGDAAAFSAPADWSVATGSFSTSNATTALASTQPVWPELVNASSQAPLVSRPVSVRASASGNVATTLPSGASYRSAPDTPTTAIAVTASAAAPPVAAPLSATGTAVAVGAAGWALATGGRSGWDLAAG